MVRVLPNPGKGCSVERNDVKHFIYIAYFNLADQSSFITLKKGSVGLGKGLPIFFRNMGVGMSKYYK